MKKKLEVKAVANELASDGVSRISGFAAVYDVVDRNDDLIKPGAFAHTIAEHQRNPMKLYVDHSDIPVTGMLKAKDLLGTIDVLEDRFMNGKHGLYYEAKISQAPSVQDIALKVKEGHLRENSFAFRVEDHAFGRTQDGRRVRIIKDLRAREISIVASPVNQDATVTEVKSDMSAEELKKLQEEMKAMKEALANQDKITEDKKTEVKSDMTKEELKALQDELKAMRISQAKMEKDIEASARLPKEELKADDDKKEDKKEEKKEEVKEEANLSDELKADKEMEAFAGIFTAKGNILEQQKRIDEYKALRTNVDADGGLTAPTKIVEKIKEKKQQINRIQNRVLRQPVNGAINLLDFDFSESFPAQTENEESTIEAIVNAFGSSLLDPQDFSVIVKLSDRLKRRSIIDMSGFISNRYVKFSENQLESHIMAGTGDKQPIGITKFMDDVNDANQVKLVTGGTIVAKLTATIMRTLEMTLDEEYRMGAELYCSKIAIREMKLIKNGAGNFIWQDSLIPGQPSTFMGYPVYESKSLEAGTSAGHQPIVFCDPSEYMLAIEEEFNTEILNQYRSANQTGLKFNKSYAGCPLDKNAFASLEVQA